MTDQQAPVDPYARKYDTVPAVVIGVGGTGDAVLREVRAGFLRVNKDLPDNIRFVGIDTAAIGVPAWEDDEVAKQNPLPTLEPQERVRISGNLRSVANSVRNADLRYRIRPHATDADSLPHLRSWFLADEYLRHLPAATWGLAAGAGQLRQFGRMGVFQTEGQAGKPLRAAIRRALQDVARYLGADQPLEVYVVSSVAGGTGAGMVIDVSHITRQEAARVTGESVTVRAFLFMAKTFEGVQGINSRALQARAYATMREINRFTNDLDMDYPYPMAYEAAQVGDSLASIKDALFDHVYYIDGFATRNSYVREDPTAAHFPMVAEAIRSLIDAASGSAYVQYTANVRGNKRQLKNTPVASAVGAYAFALPVQAWRKGFEVRLAQAALDALAPVAADGGKLDPFAHDAAGRPGQAGQSVALPFLKRPEVTRGVAPDGRPRVVRASGFPSEIGEIAGMYRAAPPPVDDAAGRLEADAWTAFTSSELAGVEGDVAGEGVPAAPRWPSVVGTALLQGVDADVGGGAGAPTWWPTGQQRKSQAIDTRVTRYVTQQFGAVALDVVGGGVVPAALDDWTRFHQRRFREVLGVQVDDLLDPPGAGASVALRRARLGHVQDFLRGVSEHLATFDRAMSDVEALRNGQARTSMAADRFRQAQSAMLDDAHRARRFATTVLVVAGLVIGAVVGLASWATGATSILWSAAVGVVVGIVVAFGLSLVKGPAYAAQEAYPEAADALLRERMSDALVRAMRATATEMRRDVESVRAAVDAWADALRTSRATRAVGTRLADAANALGRERGQINLARTYLWDSNYEDERYQAYVQIDPQTGQAQKVGEFLANARWEPVTWVGNRATLPWLRIGAGRKIGAPSARAGQDGRFTVAVDAITLASEAIDRELRAWAAGVFDGFEKSVHVVSYLRHNPRFRDPLQFAKALLEKTNEVRLDIDRSVEDLPERLNYNFLRIPDLADGVDPALGGDANEGANEGQATEIWIRAVLDELDRLQGGANHVVRGRSADPHTCALVYTADFLDLRKAVRGYTEAEEEFQRFNDNENKLGVDRRPLHCFAAEMNATAYEQRMPSLLNQAERPLDNRVVRLMEYPKRVELFLQARALNLVRHRRAGGAIEHIVFVDGRSGNDLALTVPSERGLPDMYAALVQFVCGGEDADAALGGRQNPIRFEAVQDIIEEVLRERVPGDGAQQDIERLDKKRHALAMYQAGSGEADDPSFENDWSGVRRLRDGNPDSNNPAKLTQDLQALLKMVLDDLQKALLDRTRQSRDEQR